MTIEQTDVVDFVSLHQVSDEVVLTISDHLKWSDEPSEHLFLLQEKVNRYLAFVESGEIFESYPDAKGRDVVINLVGKYELNDVAQQFFSQMASAVEGADIQLRFSKV